MDSRRGLTIWKDRNLVIFTEIIRQILLNKTFCETLCTKHSVACTVCVQ